MAYYNDRHRPFYDRGGRPYYDAPVTFRDPYADYWDPYTDYRSSDYGRDSAYVFQEPYTDYRRGYGPSSSYPFQELYTDHRRDYNRRSSSYPVQEPYRDYRRDHDRRGSYDGRHEVVPMEQVHRQEGTSRWMTREYRHGQRHGNLVHYHDDRRDMRNHSRKTLELWVPLCCEECERKVRKHLGEMEGCESVTTDQVTKKVVVVGNVRPDFVLSRVRRDKPGAEFWSARHRE